MTSSPHFLPIILAISLLGALIMPIWLLSNRIESASLLDNWGLSAWQLTALLGVTFSGLMARLFPAHDFFFMLPTMLFMILALLAAHTFASLFAENSLYQAVTYQTAYHFVIFLQLYLGLIAWRSVRRQQRLRRNYALSQDDEAPWRDDAASKKSETAGSLM